MRIERFGTLHGETVDAYTLTNREGMEVTVLPLGATISKVVTPDRTGQLENVVLGFDTIEEYLNHSSYFGAVCGRVAGRIAHGHFELNGVTYQLDKNNGEHHLHGGQLGFDKKVWSAQVIKVEGGHDAVQFQVVSPDGEGGYPGTVTLTVTYIVTDNNEFIARYEATTDQDTLLNVTNHSYFNLSGNSKHDILDHIVTLPSEEVLELDETLIPTGNLLPVTGTPYDFRGGRRIREGVESGVAAIEMVGGGYDHPFVLNGQEALHLYEEESGRMLTIETDQPVVVMYTGNFIEEGSLVRGVPSRKYLGICLETQGYPNAVHHPNFPSVVLKAGQQYSSMTTYRFSVTR